MPKRRQALAEPPRSREPFFRHSTLFRAPARLGMLPPPAGPARRLSAPAETTGNHQVRRSRFLATTPESRTRPNTTLDKQSEAVVYETFVVPKGNRCDAQHHSSGGQPLNQRGRPVRLRSPSYLAAIATTMSCNRDTGS